MAARAAGFVERAENARRRTRRPTAPVRIAVSSLEDLRVRQQPVATIGLPDRRY